MAVMLPLPVARATGHQKAAVRQPSAQVRIDHGTDLAADTADDPNAGAGKGPFKRIRNGAAYQHVHSKGGNLYRPKRVPAGEHCIPPTGFPSLFDVDQAQGLRHVENRRNASLPVRNRDPHKKLQWQTSCHCPVRKNTFKYRIIAILPKKFDLHYICIMQLL